MVRGDTTGDTDGATGKYAAGDTDGAERADATGDEADRRKESPTASEDEEATKGTDMESTGPAWLAEAWYRTMEGRAMIVFDVLLTLLLVYATIDQWGVLFPELDSLSTGAIPGYIYVLSVLGALGFIFTTLIEDFDATAADLIRYNFRLPAALPLGAGVFLVSDVALGGATETGPVIIGAVFLAGLYVNLAYKRLGALARRLLPGKTESQNAGPETRDEADTTEA